MSSTEKALIDEILADARKQAERIARRAKRDAEKASARIEEQARKEADAIRKQARSEADIKKRAILARVGQKVKRHELLAREKVLSVVKDEAWQVLVTAVSDQEKYCAVLVGLVTESVGQMSGDSFQVLFRSEDKGKLAERVLGEAAEAVRKRFERQVKLSCADQTVKTGGGFVVKSSDGSKVADQTFEGRLERLWPELRQLIAPVLFPELKRDKSDKE